MKYQRMPIEKESPEESLQYFIECNLAESSVSDMLLSELPLLPANLKLEYVPHRGHHALRQMMGEEMGLPADSILLTVGAAGALFIIYTALLEVQDHLVVIRPNYATNIEVPKSIGCEISFADLSLSKSWRPGIENIISLVRPETKIISITTPHNPTGMVFTEEELKQLISFAEEKNILLLADETYRDACYKTPYPLAASLSRQVISVGSLSKTYGLPGLRLGWIVSANEELMESFLAAKEMIHISNSALDEAMGYLFMKNKPSITPGIVTSTRRKYDILSQWLAGEEMLEAILPAGGVVCFAHIRDHYRINTDALYKILLEKYHTMVGPGHWFNMPDRYMRIGFGWPDEEGLKKGLQNISSALREIS